MYEAPYTDEQCCKEDAASEHQGADTLNHKWLDELMSVLARQMRPRQPWIRCEESLSAACQGPAGVSYAVKSEAFRSEAAFIVS